VEYANVLLVSRVDVIGKGGFAELAALLRGLNPGAKILPVDHGVIDLPEVLGTRMFDLPSLAQSPGWMSPLIDEGKPSEADTYGIASWVYRARVPFHPGRLHALLARRWSNGLLLRCKGYFWLASRLFETGQIAQSGGRFDWEFAGRWWRFIPESDWPADDYRKRGILESWSEEVGDCRQEIVFIGQGIDWARVQADLDACLLSMEEIETGPEAWATLSGYEFFMTTS